MEDQDDKRGFKVQDRRRFSAEGEAKAEGDESSADRAEAPSRPKLDAGSSAKPEAGISSKPEPAAKPDAAQSSGASASALEVTFAAFVWSLSEQALAALGEIPDPATGKVMRDLVMAQQMIDIIIMLRDKTRGNLDQHEQTLVQEILSTLEMKYVELARQPGR